MQELREIIDSIYSEVLESTARTVRNCKHFSIELLRQEDPSYQEVAETLEEAAAIINAVADVVKHDPECMHKAYKAQEYALDVSRIAKAIAEDDEELLRVLTKELDERPFL